MKIPGYRIAAELVHNEHTAVYRAVRERDGLPVIVKTLSREYPSQIEMRRLEFEHRMLCKLRGAGVIGTLALERTGRSLALILTDMGGQSLAELPLPLSLPDFLLIALPLCRALGRVHSLQVMHKDIRPQNVLVSADRRLLELINFQLSSELSRERQEVNINDQIEGALPYLSPEQTGRMNRSLDYRSDYYSLGVTFFQLLTGKLPFKASDVLGWVHCHISRTPPFAHNVNPSVPPMLSAIVHKLLAKEPQQRYQSASGLLADLEKVRSSHAANRDGDAFAIGVEDVSERFSLAQQIVGRSREVEQLLRVFEASSGGSGKLLLVSGSSGVGKSSLIRELHRPVTSKHGYFISGKFDQLDRSVPYSALVQAFRSLVEQLLSESDRQIQDWRERILGAIGPGASVMVELIPELARLVGPQPPSPPLDPTASQNRFKFVFGQFIKSLSRPQQPLLIFLDDLHWADSSTLDLIADLFCNHDLRHLLLVAAYRDNEVADGHLLEMALLQIRERAPNAISVSKLEPLDEASVAELLGNSLECPPDECQPLARVIYEKTRGNPFFASELLLSLYREGAIFRAQTGRWAIDLEAPQRLAVSDNVVDLMVGRLEKLPEATLRALRVAACVGNVFSLSTLGSLLEMASDAVARLLWEPVNAGLLVPLDDNFRLMHFGADDGSPSDTLDVSCRFQHDSIQQAAYSLIPEQDRNAVHLRIGRRLLASEANPRQPGDVFGPISHLNLGCRLIEDVAEREALARLNQKAAARALGATAFGIAAAYHDAGCACLSSEEWAARPELRFALFSERVASVLLAGERERAAALCEGLFAIAPSKAARGGVFLQSCQVMLYQGRMVDALAAVRTGLALFEIDFPEDPAAIGRGIAAGIGKMQAHLARVSIEGLLDLPELTHPEKVVAMQLLFLAVPPAVIVYPPLSSLAQLLMFDLALLHGTTAVSARNFVACGMIQGALLEDYGAAYRLGKIAFKVLERYDARALASQVHCVFAAYVSPWGAPYAESMESFRQAHRLGIETGDHQHLAFSEALRLRMLINLGRHLDECDTETRATRTLFDRIRAGIEMDAVRLCQHAIDRLRARSERNELQTQADEQLTREIVQSGNAQSAFQHGQIQMLVNTLLGDWQAALVWSRFTEERLMAASSLLSVPEYQLCECLITTQQRWPHASESERPALLGQLEERKAKLRAWAERCPENFAHKYQLVAAEIARIEREPVEVVTALYEQATASTGEAFLHLRALATELHGRYWLARGNRRFAEGLLRDALQLYSDWGAVAKVQRLTYQLSELFGRPRRSRNSFQAVTTLLGHTSSPLFDATLGGSLDLASVLKATQAISGELESERLFTRLLSALLESAAAEHGCLILPEDGSGTLIVRARADLRSNERDVTAHHELHREPRVCAQIVRYVARSLEPLVIDDAMAHPSFGGEPYVQGNGVKSVLCMPILNRGGLVAVLYVENNAVTYAFSAERVETLRLIAGQAAISISNAALYESLERKLEDRTRELAAKTRKVAALLDGMQQGVFTIDAGLMVQPEYSGHLELLLGRTSIVGRPLTEILFTHSELSADVLSTNESALRFSFGASLAIARANADHLIRAYTRLCKDGSRQHLELDWNWVTDENGKVDRVLVTARDVTLLRGLQQAAAQAARETALMSEILNAGIEDFRSFAESVRRSLRDSIAQAGSHEGFDREQLRATFRAVHTIKGHARTLGLRQVVSAAHAAEAVCSGEGEQVFGLDGAIYQSLVALDLLVSEYEGIGERRLGKFWGGADERFKQAMGAIESALNQASERPSYPVRALSEVKHAMHRINAVPLHQLLRETARVFPSLAEELGKSVPELEVNDEGTLLDPEWGRVMKDAFVHSFRNSLDHGIETPAERALAGKCPRGKIALRTERDEKGVRIHLSDDGRGLPIEALRTKTGNRESPDLLVAESIFDFGVSTAKGVSRVSGRGIGMDAVRVFLRERGGDVAIEFTGEAQLGHRPFELVFRLPSDAALKR